MKKSLLALAAMGAFAGAAQAQSSVTVYGVLDQAIGSFNNGSASSTTNEPTITSNTTGLMATQRLGFRGTEDLGGGNRANFVIEGGLTNGAAVSFARATYVEYVGKSWGALSVGWRDLGTTNIDDLVSQAGNLGAAMTTAGAAAISNATGNGDALGNDNANAIVYTSPTIAGFSVEIGYKAPHTLAATGTGTASRTIGTSTESQMGGRIDYTYQNLKVAIGQTQGNTTASDTATNRKLTSMGASYDFGVVSVGYNHMIADQSSTVTHRYNNFSAKVPVTKTISLHGVYQTAKASETEEATGFTFAVSQTLSKRSTIYAQYSALDNKGANAGYGMRGTGAVATAGDTQDPKAFAVGFLHTF
jgi:predicted porin